METENNYLDSVEFKAGKMDFNSETKMVTPDTRKGKVRVFHNTSDEKHFQWIDENTNKEEMDLYVFANDAKYARVGKAQGRVFLLSFKDNEDKYFFWMQETDESKDEEICTKVNGIINREGMEEEPAPAPAPVAPAQPAQSANTASAGANPPAAIGSTGGKNTADLGAQLAQQLMRGLQGVQRKKESPSLLEIFRGDYLDKILEDEDFRKALIEYMKSNSGNMNYKCSLQTSSSWPAGPSRASRQSQESAIPTSA
eukprot:TRINITY_DN6153_c0_g2_i1.p1 TRINITY_DN6153_c0_g2~~TRINITY_DN6153_c0_g2_i1.p1  ORF type:complete len:255 (-),score=60.30 TRINITY_DN6153_c0_g2_i1:295-1059(-)